MTDRDLLQQIGKLRLQVQELEAERNAARDMALEEVANYVEKWAEDNGMKTEWDEQGRYAEDAAMRLAAEIRALKSKSE